MFENKKDADCIVDIYVSQADPRFDDFFGVKLLGTDECGAMIYDGRRKLIPWSSIFYIDYLGTEEKKK